MKTLQKCVLLPCHDGHAQWGEIIYEKTIFVFKNLPFLVKFLKNSDCYNTKNLKKYLSM